jgi:hypothetical protein
MKIARAGHTATLLISGRVLVTGGGDGKADPTAELYDPASGTFSSTAGNMTEARISHTATLLKLGNPEATNHGKVLIVGSGTSAELYDPSAGRFVPTGSLHHARSYPTATLLKTGKVLIVGGNSTSGDLVAELYNPASGTFFDTGRTTTLRIGHTATLLLDGRVLIAGGGNNSNTAELYNPSGAASFAPESDGFTVTGRLNTNRDSHTATVLQDGTVLVIGGMYRVHELLPYPYWHCLVGNTVLSSAELFR